MPRRSPANQHTLKVDVPQGLWVEADPVRLEQIIANLLANAAKYSDVGGQIWLSAAQEAESIAIGVRDAGIGIRPEQLSRVFDLFAQGDHSLARSEGGPGIGLALVRTLAELHGGSVSVTSAGRGTGSEFVIRIPASGRPADRPRAPASQVEPAAVRGLGILVIEDNHDVAQGLATLLKLLDHQVWIAYNSPSGLAAARGHRPDVVLLDIGLPGTDGYQVAEQLRGEDLSKRLFLIAVTGYGHPEDRQRARRVGFDQFLTKPVDYATLAALLPGPASADS